MSETFEGACRCGAVRVKVSGPPAMQGFCHCADCRGWSGAPVTSYSIWPSGQVEVTAGADRLREWSAGPDAVVRCSCAECGSLMMVRLMGGTMTDVFPSRLEGFAFEPAAHVFYAERAIDMADALPKFVDMPEPMGSGRLHAT